MKYFSKYFEITAWISALTLLAFMNPSTDAHYSFCIFKFMGISYCPGCGLGHSISYLFHGNLKASLDAHPLGIVAVPVIITRIYKLSCLHIFNHLTQHGHGQQF